MKVSIVMAYHNRRLLLLNTLQMLEYYNHGDTENLEVIVVDDASDSSQTIDKIADYFSFPIYILRIEEEEKRWLNPCVPYNIGFGFASGDAVIIQNPECLHVGDIVECVRQNLSLGSYLTFSTYSINQVLQDKLTDFLLNNPELLDLYDKNKLCRIPELITNMLSPLAGKRENWHDGEICWYNHPLHNPSALHFCSAIMRKDLEDLSGFDERFAPGFAYDDNEFLMRIRRKGMAVKWPVGLFVIHQAHKVSDYVKHKKEFEANRRLLESVTLEKNVKAPENVFYNK
jgi:glycosyltransferase involved in cell wall biosynthesis